MSAIVGLSLSLILSWAFQAAGPQADSVTILRGLDKVTARITELRVPTGEPVVFGSLRITARHCENTPPTEPPETSAFLQIDDTKAEEGPKRLFSGWMFASSPGINALEHPGYDVWVIDCKTAPAGEGEPSE